ncbi:hypothetical protein DOMOVOI_01670 [Brevundimonas phage vB_BpoS-Domovoi]|uniref:Uncharacterized protein n=1 Tax=Brevundimonas phage vB_BpoS-Domovoi TaxID=2948598 RepID=A0A9E7MPS0_9CAUD|nr:hypothetical protein DOMOVOI_01670 [Brevundimonas phage vB_BpoS-Domovoi]
MNLNRRTVFTALAALVGLPAVAGIAPAPQGMDPESAQMEDDAMWAAVARAGAMVITADSGADTLRYSWLGEARRTPMREDPALRALVVTAVADGRLRPCEQDAQGQDVVWEVTLKGRLYACEKTLEGDPDQVYTFRQVVERGGWAFKPMVVNRRVARLLLPVRGGEFGTHEPFIHNEYAGAVQAGLVYPVRAVWSPQGSHVTFKPSDAARDVVRAEVPYRPQALRRMQEAAYSVGAPA